jgi:hypothetical protein
MSTIGSASVRNGASARGVARRSRVKEHRQDDELAVPLLRHEGHRRSRHDVRNRRHVVGRGIGSCDEAGDRLRSCGEHQHPAGDAVDGLQAICEACRDAEVAAAAANRPEQIGVHVGIRLQEPAVRGHDVGAHEAVDREPVLAYEETDAAAERQSSDPHRAGVAEADAEAVFRSRSRELTRGQTRLRPGKTLVRVDLQRLQPREI